MAIIKSKPITPSLRNYVKIKNEYSKVKPCKTLTKGKKAGSGRNNRGVITVRHKGGGHKRKLRLIDFNRSKENMYAEVKTIEYDPNRTANIALVEYEDGEKSYIIAPKDIEIGNKIISGDKVEISSGNCTSLRNIPIGTVIHNIELKPNAGAKLARSAGSYAQLVSKDSGFAKIKLRSGETRIVSLGSKAVIGVVSNHLHQNRKIGKAGRKRWMGIRPTVRGVVMNPVDHPHGGGEGKTSGGRHPVTPKGVPTKGKKTRKNKRTDKFIVTSRKKARKSNG